MKVNYKEAPGVTTIVRHWRLVWTPWGSLLCGRVNGNRSVWIETKKNLWYVLVSGSEEKD